MNPLAKPSLDFFLKILIPISPILGYSTNLYEASVAAGLIFFLFLISLPFYKIAERIFPRRLLSLSLIIWLGCWAQITFYLWDIHPLWVVSLLLLFLSPEEKKNRFSFPFAVGFCLFFISLGFFQGFAGQKLPIFGQPAGGLFLLAAGAFTAPFFEGIFQEGTRKDE